MELKDGLNVIISSDCDCCNHLAYDSTGALYGCAEKEGVFTVREQEVLRRIREVGQRARGLKERIRNASTGGVAEAAERERAVEELEALRHIRAELEMERVAAADDRMRLLGHA